ncbi:hypothetical protein [Galbibacter pacificus]|uniref:Uncharacterized protein n=1 Tax=Galbibacter pacificus TaxID=2996052 RepID=A0ABT6FWQ6_9FLAO|nr:hypothetical protein [Galbibacter pacificus]MDG3584208.1 hypothetical protein [Galbibacter pacificus]MDG3587682.1 hypothetical protein [Galbibacter pacificus]
MEINKNIVDVLNKMNFAERYKILCDTHDKLEDRMGDEHYLQIENFFVNKNLPIKYMKKEKFFMIKEAKRIYDIQLNIIPYKGFIQFVIDVRKNKERLNLALGTWESITKILKGYDVKKPIYTSLEDLFGILEDAFSIYEDFKHELLEQENI